MLETFLKDLKHALRMFAQSPAFTLAAVAALTLGIGANTAIFSVVNAVLLKPVAFPDPDRVVVFMNVVAARLRPGGVAGEVRSTTGSRPTSSRTSSAFRTGVVNYTGGSFPEQLRSGQVSADFFRLVRRAGPARPHLHGRRGSAERRRGSRSSADGSGRRRFNADPNIVGKTISLGGEPYTIVGVLGRVRLPRVRPDAAGLGAVPARSRTRPTRATTSRRWAG